MNKEKAIRVCPVEHAGSLDNSVRRFLHNPKKILTQFIKNGMTVLDLGCGPGVFTVQLAKLVGDSGKVIAADLQEGMLEIVRQKIKGTELESKVILHKCQDESIGVSEKVDFVLAFYMVHEVHDKDKLFVELKSILNPDGRILIVEPKFEVTGKMFMEMKANLKGFGFEILTGPKVFFSRSVILKNLN